eukprot:14377415-Ditylum_brightwellii.AAC.1
MSTSDKDNDDNIIMETHHQEVFYITISSTLKSERQQLSPDHPLHAYSPDDEAMVEMLKEEPHLWNMDELPFLRDYVKSIKIADQSSGC